MANVANQISLNTTIANQLGTSLNSNTFNTGTASVGTVTATTFRTNQIQTPTTQLTISPTTDSVTGTVILNITPNTWTASETATVQFGTSAEAISASPTQGLSFITGLGIALGSLGTPFKNVYTAQASFPPGVTSSTTFNVTLPVFSNYRFYSSITKSSSGVLVLYSLLDFYNPGTGLTTIRVIRLDTNATWTGTHFVNILFIEV